MDSLKNEPTCATMALNSQATNLKGVSRKFAELPSSSGSRQMAW